MAAPTTLHKFTLLPPELRNSIWESALPPPRVFDIYPASTSQKTPAAQGLRFDNPYSEPPPPLAAACRESRSLALHHYQALTLGGTTKYVDLARDVLLLESYLFERDLLRTLQFMGRVPLIRDGLRSLAFGTSYGVHTGLWHPVLGWKKLTRSNMGRLLQRLAAFGRLQRLVLVVRQEVQYELAGALPLCAGRGTACAWVGGGGDGGQVARNAAFFQRGSTPPPGPRVLEPAAAAADDELLASRASSPSTLSEASCGSSDDVGGGCSSFYRMPWTEEKPCLPHGNELAYYPPDPSEDDDTDPVTTITEGPPRLQSLGPTHNDWLRFRRAFKRDLEAGLDLGLAAGRKSMGACGKRKRATEENERKDDAELPRPKCVRAVGNGMEGYKLPEIQGANLLWRYSLPA